MDDAQEVPAGAVGGDNELQEIDAREVALNICAHRKKRFHLR